MELSRELMGNADLILATGGPEWLRRHILQEGLQ